jgi:hypothetical protein
VIPGSIPGKELQARRPRVSSTDDSCR